MVKFNICQISRCWCRKVFENWTQLRYLATQPLAGGSRVKVEDTARLMPSSLCCEISATLSCVLSNHNITLIVAYIGRNTLIGRMTVILCRVLYDEWQSARNADSYVLCSISQLSYFSYHFSKHFSSHSRQVSKKASRERKVVMAVLQNNVQNLFYLWQF